METTTASSSRQENKEEHRRVPRECSTRKVKRAARTEVSIQRLPVPGFSSKTLKINNKQVMNDYRPLTTEEIEVLKTQRLLGRRLDLSQCTQKTSSPTTCTA